MKYREHNGPLLAPETYIHLWKAASKLPKDRPARVSKDLWRQILAKVIPAKVALLLVACSPKPEPPALDPLGLVWVQPDSAREERAKTLPRVEGNPFNL